MQNKKQTFSLWRVAKGVANGIGLCLLVFYLLVLLIDIFRIPIFLVIIIIVLGFLFRKKIFLLWKKMNKKKQTFSPLQVIFMVGILMALLIMGIDNRNIFLVEHEKEIKKWEEKVEKSCSIQCVSEIKELPKLLFGREGKEALLETVKKRDSGNPLIERLEEELNAKTKYYCKDGNCDPFTDPCENDPCIINKKTLSNIENENPPSIFHYYGIIIGGIGGIIDFVLGSVVSMFFILLILILIILIEVVGEK